MTEKYYVYVLLDPRKPVRMSYSLVSFLFHPYYVGKGSGDRWQKHFRESNFAQSRNPKKDRLIKKLQREGLTPKLFVCILYCTTEQEAFDLEVKLLREIGRDRLTNLNDGGLGSSGLKHSKEWVEMIKRANRKPKPLGFGEKVSKAKKGVPMSAAHRAKILGRAVSKETREKIRAKLKGRKLSEETKEKMRKSRNPSFRNPSLYDRPENTTAV